MTHPLPKPLRNQLETAVKAAREVAETAAGAVLARLGVAEARAPEYLDVDQKLLRRRLRAHAQALGDRREEDGRQALTRLIWEVAYEHWHRMLFARFLAENGLLLWEPGAPLSLEECREIVDHDPAMAMGARSAWELAGMLAARMLPQIFRPQNPVYALAFAPEHQRDLERLLAGLSAEVFVASDSLGWVYQFWQAKRKQQVNDAEVKIGADELPAVTQLFTEPYMVDFLLHNALGAWWVTRHPERPCPVPLPYLRTISATNSATNSPLPPGEGPGVRAASPPVEASGVRAEAPAKSVKRTALPPGQLVFARQLRQQQTDAETRLWYLLRDRRLADCKFRRQHPTGRYFLDFYCHERRLAVELDGGQHAEAQEQLRDQRRSDWLASQGIRVLRFWNDDVLLRTESVLQVIWDALHDDVAVSPDGHPHPGPLPEDLRPHPGPLPEGEGETRLIPAAGRFEGWPDHLADFRLLDPCCGSGHFLVAAFLLLVPMRQVAEGLSAAAAVDAVLRENLHGLELDPRCVEIAVFALALAAWRYPDEQGRPLGVRLGMPVPQVACCGLKVSASAEDWMALVPDGTPRAAYLRQELGRLHAAFAQAPLLGSLLDPARTLKQDLASSNLDTLRQLLDLALLNNSPLPPGEGPGVRAASPRSDGAGWEEGPERWEQALRAQGLLEAARLLEARYHLVVTNVPYLARGKQSEALKDYCAVHYPEAKNDLANVFLERCLELAASPPLSACSPLPAGEGPGVRGMKSETATSAGVVQVVMPQNWLFLASYEEQRKSLLDRTQWNLLAKLGPGAFETLNSKVVQSILLTQTGAQLGDAFYGIDASNAKLVEGKSAILALGRLLRVEQQRLINPANHYRVSLEPVAGPSLLEKFATPFQGITTGDNQRFIRFFWELRNWGKDWLEFQSTGDVSVEFGGREQVFLWEQGRGLLANIGTARIQGQSVWGRSGVTVRQMGAFAATLNCGSPWDMNSTTFIPVDPSQLPAIWCFFASPEFVTEVKRIDQSFKVTTATMAKVPFDLAHWQQVAAERYPNGLPKPYSDDPTQWLFHGHPQPATDPLQVAVARLAGYRWPAETDPTMELADEARRWIAHCAALDAHTDDDGILCLPSVRGEPPAHERLLKLLIDAWNVPDSAAASGSGVQSGSWKPAVLDKLLADADCAGKGLDVWLRDKFFEQHCKRFRHRPFVWHLWDGLKDGFAALVHYHRLDAKTLERLIHTYLGDWIRQQEAGLRAGIDGAQTRLAAAQDLKRRLELILEGEKPYDIYVRWKPLAEQPIGWNPDLNDGVRLNIRPFVKAEVLRHYKKPKLNIHWDKDRGKDVESAPWFKVFHGERINDHHLTLEQKRAARTGAAP